ncbi:MAG: prepilin peptidase [Elusimicrobia bacterium]|nr:prepilin peptidase [Candidatus Liberimonas magnetica]
MITYLFICFIFGLIAGSFANVCIYRIPNNLSVVKPRSFCKNCKNRIAWYDNIPVLSFLVLSGKCRHCKEKISLIYPFIEILTGILFILLGWRFMYQPASLFVYSLFTVLLVIIAVIDYQYQIIPDILSLCILILGISFCFFNRELGTNWQMRFLNSILGGVVSAGCLFVVGYLGTMVLKKDAMGGGDIKFILAAGTLVGLKKAFLTIFFASIIGSIIGLMLIVLKKNKRNEYIPFGPFLSLAAYFILFIPSNWLFW